MTRVKSAFGAIVLACSGAAGAGDPSADHSNDWPQSAIDAHEQGTVFFHLGIGKNGRVTGCQITKSSVISTRPPAVS